uniref:NADH-ubiquinone oxidoreductase chain 2 n=1 Tax=Eubranchipus grubii TaxID=381661 RepID=A0A7D7J5U7_9CRUS|nr:NADH dehydrogenase subunit 2 [Eubranchipus grubii]QMP96528.1 NADH dehydrogenase subunit 2 [Eubranchipus grubii]
MNCFFMMKWLILTLSYMMMMSTESWLGLWLALELNALSFIPILICKDKEMSLKYFLIQSLGSLFFLSGILNPLLHNVMICGLLLKIGVAPLHLWVPAVTSNMTWVSLFLLLTFQKLGPLLGLVMLTFKSGYIIMLTAIMGALGGIIQSNLRLLITYSSITHLSWVFLNMSSMSLLIIYFVVYSLITFTLVIVLKELGASFLSQMSKPMSLNMKGALSSSLLSLGGLPPLLGFMIKWMTLENSMPSLIISTVLIFSTCLSLFFYFKIMMIPILSPLSLSNNSQWAWGVVSLHWIFPMIMT